MVTNLGAGHLARHLGVSRVSGWRLARKLDHNADKADCRGGAKNYRRKPVGRQLVVTEEDLKVAVAWYYLPGHVHEHAEAMVRARPTDRWLLVLGDSVVTCETAEEAARRWLSSNGTAAQIIDLDRPVAVETVETQVAS